MLSAQALLPSGNAMAMEHTPMVPTALQAAAGEGSETALAAGYDDDDSEEKTSDYLERYNRKMFAINVSLDEYLLRPIAVLWNKFVPEAARSSVRNFFSNLETPSIVFNQLLQARFDEAAHNTSRFIFNSTMGIAGLVDAGSSFLNLKPTKGADLGQTMALWGVPSGPIVMLPGLGPSTTRNLPNLVTKTALNPLNYQWVDSTYRVPAAVVDILSARGDFIGADLLIYESPDPYRAAFDLYMQSRTRLVNQATGANGDVGASNEYDEDFFDSLE